MTGMMKRRKRQRHLSRNRIIRITTPTRAITRIRKAVIIMIKTLTRMITAVVKSIPKTMATKAEIMRTMMRTRVTTDFDTTVIRV